VVESVPEKILCGSYSTTPSAGNKVASRLFLTPAATPPNLGGDFQTPKPEPLLNTEKPFGSDAKNFRTVSKLPNLSDSRSLVGNAAASGLCPLLHPLVILQTSNPSPFSFAEKPFGSHAKNVRTVSKLPDLSDSRSLISNAAASGLGPLLHPLVILHTSNSSPFSFAEKPFGSHAKNIRTVSKLPNLSDSRSLVSDAAASGLCPLLHPLVIPPHVTGMRTPRP
jgi:hypothetical protein